MIIVCEHQYELGRPWNEQKRYLIIESFKVYKQKLLCNELTSLSKYSFRNSSIVDESEKQIIIKYPFTERFPYECVHVGRLIDNPKFEFGEDMIYDAINKKYIHSEEELHESLH